MRDICCCVDVFHSHKNVIWPQAATTNSSSCNRTSRILLAPTMPMPACCSRLPPMRSCDHRRPCWPLLLRAPTTRMRQHCEQMPAMATTMRARVQCVRQLPVVLRASTKWVHCWCVGASAQWLLCNRRCLIWTGDLRAQSNASTNYADPSVLRPNEYSNVRR